MIARHADAWMIDPWYRRAWFVTPCAAVLMVGTLVIARPTKLVAPPTPPGWVHPNGDMAAGVAMAVLRDQAKTNPEALAVLRRQALEGSRNAQFYMGTLLDPTIDRPHASPERTREAIGWYRKAADQQLALAAGNLGFLLAYDRPGSPADYAEAFRALDFASASVPLAQRELGQLYRLGHGVPIDVAKGLDLIRTAAEHNDASAQTMLAQAYDRGTDGLTQDAHEAALLYQRAALAGNVFAEREIGIHLLNGNGVPADRAKAMSWFRKAADKGDPFAKAQIAGPSGGDAPGATAPSRAPSLFSFPSIRP